MLFMAWAILALTLTFVPYVVRTVRKPKAFRDSVRDDFLGVLSMWRCTWGWVWKHKALMWIPPVLLIAVLCTTLFLYGSFPLLRHGWLVDLLGITANANSGESSSFTPGDPLLNVAMGVFWLGSCGLILLFLLPKGAHDEEVAFRLAVVERPAWRKLLQAVWFGAAHLVMGIPIAVALALIIPGLVFQVITDREYQRIRNADQSRRAELEARVDDDTVDDSEKIQCIKELLQVEKSEILQYQNRQDIVIPATAVHFVYNVMVLSLLSLMGVSLVVSGVSALG